MKPSVSVIIPVFNEEDSLRPLWDALKPVLNALENQWEVIFCDDGSADKSADILEELAQENSGIKVVFLRRNFGQTAAMDAGFKHASGDILIPMDADLQNDPQDIPVLLEEMVDGVDVVKGWRKFRKDPYWTKTLPSQIANRIISRTTGVRLHDYGCTLSAYRKEVLQEVHLYGEMHRFIPVYAHWAGAKLKEIAVRHHPRKFGVSKYTLGKTFRVILDLATVRFLNAYSTKPLYFFGRFAASVFTLAFFSGVTTLFKKGFGGAEGFWTGPPLYTDPFFFLSIFLGISGVQVILFGLLAELNVRTYYESQGKRPYVVRSTRNLELPFGSNEKPGIPCAE